MPIINKCPLCGKSNCVEVVQFTIDNNQYTAYKCTTTNNILNSVRNDVEKTLDGVLLCSDGLTNMVSVEQMEKILRDEDLDIEEQVGKMIMKANMRGGTDNITVACVRFGGE